MKKSKLTKLFAAFLVMTILFGTFTGAASVIFAAEGDGTSSETTSGESSSDDTYGYTRTLEEVKVLIDTESYRNYQAAHEGTPKGSSSILVNAVDALDAEGTTADTEIKKDFNGESKALYMGDEGKVSFKINVPQTGMYAMRITYYPVTGTNTTIERMLYIDGKVPFSEARYFYFPRVWKYLKQEDGSFEKDINGNDIRPVRAEDPDWETYYLRDWLGYTMDPFEFYLTEGEHTITFEAAREPLVVSNIEFYPYIEEAPYEEVLAGWKAAGYTEVGADVEPVKVQAEEPRNISIQNIFPANDRTSAITEPQDPARIRYNILDCGTVGQYLRYDVEVPKTGLYKIVVRFRQNSLNGLFTSRRIRINGEVPFREASYLRFVYDTAFQVKPLNDGTTEFLFLLQEGKNEIEFEVVLGSMQKYIYDIVETIDELQDAYQQILMITGPSPDASRDYNFGSLVPGAIYTLAKAANTLYSISDDLIEITGEMGDQVASLETYALLFKDMAMDEYEIAPNFTNFKNYTVLLSNWLYACLGQPLKMDYFVVQSPETKDPSATANFFQAAWFEIRAFFASFFMDYTTIGFVYADDSLTSYDKNLTLWASGDREGTLITRRIIDSYYTPEYQTSVTIKVISAGLTEAIIAGIGPDIAGMGSTDTITWGLRTAVLPLNDYEGFDEVTTYFPECAMVPLTLYGTTYGLPTGISFNMTYYRLDVLAELGLDIPKTWDDLYSMMSILQNKRLEIGMPTGLGGTNMFLYQSGVELYRDDGMAINLDSNEALSAFETLCDFYTKYSCKTSWDVSRFRTGELPIMIGSDVGTYNTLMGLRELRGLWEMAPLLGTRQEDGTIDNTSVVGVSAMIIPKGANDEVSWTYLKWNATKDTQKRLINETIAVSDPTTKCTTANLEAYLEQPWTTAEYEAISTQLKKLKGIPEYPGNYIVGTYASNAFMDVYNNHADPSSAMLDRILDINKEISRKRKEFGFEAYDVSYGSSTSIVDEEGDL